MQEQSEAPAGRSELARAPRRRQIHRTSLPRLLLAAVIALPVTTAAGEPSSRLPAVVSQEEADEIAQVLDRLGEAIVKGEAAALARFVSPLRGESLREEIRRYAAAEFRVNRYETFEFVPPPLDEYVRDGRGTITVYAEARYQYRGADGSEIKSAQAYPFTFERHEGRWYVMRSDLFDQFTGMNVESFYRQVLTLIGVVLVALVFWGWMIADCSLRYRRMGLMVLILLTPPVGALVYFVFGFLRGPKIVKPRPAGPIPTQQQRPLMGA